jgi:hypothetical protein
VLDDFVEKCLGDLQGRLLGAVEWGLVLVVARVAADRVLELAHPAAE